VIKVTLVLIIALAAAELLRRRPAALRHRVLAAAIACCAVMPAAEALVPDWELPILPARAALPSQPVVLQDDDGAGAGPQQATALERPRGSAAWFLALLPLVWGAGAGVSLVLLAVGLARLGWIASRARPIDDVRWTGAAARVAGRLGLTAAPVILQSDQPAMLFTWGLRRPKVLLPRGAEGWSDERIGMVLGHELAHIRRGDWAAQLLADYVRCAHWFNPLVWIACRRLRLESEHACDDEVLRHGVPAPDYASELLTLASLLKAARRSFYPAPAMARPSELERRVRVMLNARLDRAPIRRSSALLAWLGMLAVTVPIAGLSITPEPAPVAVSTAASTMASQPDDAPAASASRPDAIVLRPSAGRPAASRDLAAKQQSAALAGTVADPRGRPVPNVPVKVTDPATSATAETTTDQHGQFAVPNLAPGRYDVRISKPGFKTLALSLVVRAGETGRVQGVLQLGRVAESITVTPGPRPPVTPGAARGRDVAAAPVDDPCAHSTEGGCVTPPLKLADARPTYPVHHAQSGVAGEVVIDAVIGPDGSVAQLQPKPDSDPDFAAAAMHAIRLWRFSPTRLNGEPVAVDMTVTVKFQITK